MFYGIGCFFVWLGDNAEGVFIFLWSDTEFLFKGSKKVCIIFKTLSHGDFTQRLSGKKIVLAGVEPLF